MKALWIVTLLAVGLGSAYADELDIYRAQTGMLTPARIMLLIDTSLSMTEYIGGSDRLSQDAAAILNCADADMTTRKICQVKTILTRFLDVGGTDANRWPDSFEVGLARYNEPGSQILAPVKRLGDAVTISEPDADGVMVVRTITHRELLQDMVDNIRIGTYTPIVGSYFEVLQYLTGGTSTFPTRTEHDPAVWKRDEQGNVLTGQFEAGMGPTGATCGASNDHVLVLTDGFSYQDYTGSSDDAGSLYSQMRTFAAARMGAADVDSYFTAGKCEPGLDTDGNIGTTATTQILNCADALADAVVDPVPGGSGQVLGIKTHVVAFDVVQDNSNTSTQTAGQLIIDWANNYGLGQGVYAGGEDALQAAIGNIVEEPLERDTTFTATVPGVGINQANSFTHMNELFFSVFKPTANRFWYGNLKKFKLGLDNNIPVIQGKSFSGGTRNADADDDGIFDVDTFDLWFAPAQFPVSTYPGIGSMGAEPFVGGSASLSVPDDVADGNRNLFTVLPGTTNMVNLKTSTGRSSVTNAILGDSATEAETTSYDAFLQWLLGYDSADIESENEWKRLTNVVKTPRTLYGAPIHSSPVVVNYLSTELQGTERVIRSEEDQENLVFLSTNDGKLYAVDSTSGEEKLAFIPNEFLARTSGSSTAEAMYSAARNASEGDLIYGLDSTWSVWRQDVNKDGNITTGNSGDFVYLFGGMRRGGRNYYSLDVTGANDAAPSMSQRFVLKGGEAATPFENMGQTWSEPVLGVINYNGTKVVVMIVGGGYDPIYDSGRPATDARPLGNAIYVVLAYDSDVGSAGDVLWWASTPAFGTGNYSTISDLKDSIPAKVKTLDKNGDGLIDFIYAVDLGGQIHRINVDVGVDGDGNATTSFGYDLIAQLGRRGGTENEADDRRFFSAPSIAMMRDSTGLYVGIAVGSGLITNPSNSTVDERFFFIKDREPMNGMDETVLTGSDLVPLQVIDPSIESENQRVGGAVSPATAEQLLAARGFSATLDLDGEKFMGAPLIVDNTVNFTSYYNDDSGSGSACTLTPGKTAIYRYIPGVASLNQIDTNRPQTLAGDINLIVVERDPVAGDDGTLEPLPPDILGLPGPGAIDLPDIDLGNIRKTRWYQCQNATCN